MHKLILFFCGWILISISSIAAADCFIVKELNSKTLVKDGECSTRHSPCSTFKIAISLMGFDSGFLKDETNPEIDFKLGYVDWLDVWKQPHNPRTWMKHSCVWYSQCITRNLGYSAFNNYVKQFSYGNMDTQGNIDNPDGLTSCWLSSSLKISPVEQVNFLEKLLLFKLAVNKNAERLTRNILFTQDLLYGWKLYGKTGSGYQYSQVEGKNLQIGWFIGWVERSDKTLIFVQYIEDDRIQPSYASLRAKDSAIKKITNLISEL